MTPRMRSKVAADLRRASHLIENETTPTMLRAVERLLVVSLARIVEHGESTTDPAEFAS